MGFKEFDDIVNYVKENKIAPKIKISAQDDISIESFKIGTSTLSKVVIGMSYNVSEYITNKVTQINVSYKVGNTSCDICNNANSIIEKSVDYDIYSENDVEISLMGISAAASNPKVKIENLPYDSVDEIYINNKLENDFYSLIINQCIGYLFGTGLVYSIDSDKYDEDKFKEYQDELFKWQIINNIADLDMETGKYQAVCGVAYRICYIADGEESVMNIKPWEIIPFEEISWQMAKLEGEDNSFEEWKNKQIDVCFDNIIIG